MAIINFPILYIPDPVKGRPLFQGQIFVGEPDLDPEIPANQKQLNVVQEDGTLVPVAQPFILSSGGVPVYNGSAVRLDVDGNYSLKILSKQGSQVYYIESVLEGVPVTVSDGGEWFARNIDTLEGQPDSAVNLTFLQEGDALNVEERLLGNGGGAMWDVVLTSTVTPNGYDIVVSIADPSLSFVLRKNEEYKAKPWGAPADLYSQDGVKNPAPSDNWAALNDAKNEVQNSKTGFRLDGQEQGYSMSRGLKWNAGDSGIKDFYFEAEAGFPVETTNQAIFATASGLRIDVENCEFQCAGESNGIWNENNGFNNHYSNVEINDFKDFGIKIDGSGDQHLTHLLVTQKAEVADRTAGGIGVDVTVQDIKLENSVIRYAETPLKVSGNTFLGTGNHIYNGSAGSSTPATNSTSILVDGGFGSSMCHTYLDKGTVRFEGGFVMNFFDTKMLFDSTPEHDTIISSKAVGMANQFPKFVFDGAVSTVPLNNGSINFIDFVTDPSNTYSDEAQSIRDEINLRNNGYPRIVFDEVCHVVAPTRSVICEGDTQSVRHSIGSNSYGVNSSNAVTETYGTQFVQFDSAGIEFKVKASGGATSGSHSIEGNRTSSIDVAEYRLLNRRGQNDLDQTVGDGWKIINESRSGTSAPYLRLDINRPNNANWEEMFRFSTLSFTSLNDATKTCGEASFRWSDVFSVNSSNNTSDRNEKDLFQPLEESWIETLMSISNKVQKWKWKKAIEEKGDSARWHIGPIAQEVYDEFAAIGVDAFEYGFIGKDKVVEQIIDGYEEETDEDGNVIVDDSGETKKLPIYKEVETGDEIWNLRHTELQYAIQWAQQQKINQLLNN